ncbi:MAG: hypothetical protein KKH28_13020 [Elusimicrobia bacterium]|nr:hypothetical protein [Elusimicrobiota bacterium]
MKARYQIVISLSEEDNQKLMKLRDDGYQIVEIFRLGMGEAEAETVKSRKKKEPETEKREKPGETLF